MLHGMAAPAPRHLLTPNLCPPLQGVMGPQGFPGTPGEPGLKGEKVSDRAGAVTVPML